MYDKQHEALSRVRLAFHSTDDSTHKNLSCGKTPLPNRSWNRFYFSPQKHSHYLFTDHHVLQTCMLMLFITGTNILKNSEESFFTQQQFIVTTAVELQKKQNAFVWGTDKTNLKSDKQMSKSSWMLVRFWRWLELCPVIFCYKFYFYSKCNLMLLVTMNCSVSFPLK